MGEGRIGGEKRGRGRGEKEGKGREGKGKGGIKPHGLSCAS